MTTRLFHIFRNTPMGKETMLQSLYFCKMINCKPVVYIPRYTKFLMYVAGEAVQVDLDRSYLSFSETAVENAEKLIQQFGFDPEFFYPKEHTATNLPDIPAEFEYMCCPRTISDLSSKIGLGYIGSRVRKIVQLADFPVLLSGSGFKPWESVCVFFGGSENSLNALRLGIKVAQTSGKPLNLITFVENGQSKDSYIKIIEDKSLGYVHDFIDSWMFFSKTEMEKRLFNISHDSILVLGAYGHGLIRDVLFGSVMEKVQSTMPNNMLIAGPRYFFA